MFDEHFSFDTPRSPSLDSTANTISTREPSRSVSPCSPTTAFPPPRYSVTDLAANFANSRLRTDSQICYDACDSYANQDDDAGWEIPSAPVDLSTPTSPKTSHSTTHPHSPSRRLQRQSNSRLLCSMSHAKDIAALVSRMVACEDQCRVVAAGESISPTIEEDEGYTSEDTFAMQPSYPSSLSSRRSSVAMAKTRMEYRRSSDLNTTGACVSKAVRLRKANRLHKRIRSAESSGDA